MNANEFAAEFALLPPLPEGWRDSEWGRNRNAFRHHAESGPVEDFLTWSTSTKTIFPDTNPFMEKYLRELSHLADYDYYRTALELDQRVGNPPYYRGKATGGYINQVYHLHIFEAKVGCRVAEFDTIVEFGGGYGVMARVCRALGFEGDYIIYDLPELSLIQEYYLSQYGVDAVLLNVYDDGSFRSPPMDTDMLFGLYSLSEVDAQLRETFICATRAKNVMMACQDRFNGVNLSDEVTAMENRLTQYNWSSYDNPHQRGHFYTIGRHKWLES